MSYSPRFGKRASESASMSSHSHVINDREVADFIKKCEYPKSKSEVTLNSSLIFDVDYPQNDAIKHIIAVDAGFTTLPIKKTFPSSLITFFQFGTLLLNTEDLDSMAEQPFISRESMNKLKDLERSKLVLPTKNLSYNKSATLKESVRSTVYEFFIKKRDDSSLLETLHWFLFELYNTPLDSYQLASCPHCNEVRIPITRAKLDANFCQPCQHCGKQLSLTDTFRFHEVVDNETGAAGMIGYLTNLIEHFNIIHQIKNVKAIRTELLNGFLFLKDGPLAFFGQTANMHKPMRNLCNYLFQKHTLSLAGLEKSGAFVEHAGEIKDLLKPGQAMLLDNNHIYSYILPGDPGNPDPYGSTSYFSSKIIFKTRASRMHVVTIPVENENIVLNPQKADFKNIDSILWNIEKLRCDMYDNTIVPVAIANKLISLSNHPSSIILQKFAKATIK